MHTTATRSLVSLVLTLGLLASSDVCAWLCANAPHVHAGAALDAAAGSADALPDAHCGRKPKPAAPEREAPSHDGCATCTLIAAATTPSGAPALDVAPLVALVATPLDPAPLASASRAGPSPSRRLPPRDVLAITTSLRL